MAELEAELNIDFDAALHGAKELGTQIDETLSTSADALGTALAETLTGLPPLELLPDPEVLTSGITEAIQAADTEVPITGDTTEAKHEIDLLGADPIDIPVLADTTEAQAQLQELEASAIETTGSMGGAEGATSGLTDAAGKLGSASSLAVGNVGALGGIAANLGEGMGAGAGAGLALAGSIGVLTHAGIDAEGAIQRFKMVVGDLGPEIMHVKVGTLNEDLAELAIKLGTDDEALINSASNLVEYSKAAGFSSDQTVDFSHNVIGLASRAVALNPALGTVDSAAQRLTSGLARGGKIVQMYGISLTASEISARALSITHKENASELTVLEKSYAGAQIAVEKYGGSLKKDIDEGSQNAIIQQRSLKEQFQNIIEEVGKPLVAPLFDLLRATIPVAQALAEPLGRLAQVAIPILVLGLEALVPPITIVSEVLGDIPTPILTVIAGLLLLGPAMGVVGAVAGAVTGTLAVLSTAVTVAGNSAVLSAEEFSLAATSAQVAVPAIAAFSAAFIVTTKVLEATIGRGTDFKKEMDDIDKGVRVVSASTRRELVPAFNDLVDQMDDAQTNSIPKATLKLDAFWQVAKDSPEQAQALIGSLHLSAEETKTFTHVLDVEMGTQRDNRQAKEESASANAALADSYKTPIEAAEAYVTALQAEEEIQNRIINAQLGAEGAAINYAKSVQDQAQAQRDYNDVLKFYGQAAADASPQAEALREKNLALAQSTLAMDKAQHDNDVNLQDRTSVDLAIAKYTDLQAKYPDGAAALEPYLQKLRDQRDVLDFLAHLPPVVNHVSIVADYKMNILTPETSGQTGFAGSGTTGDPDLDALFRQINLDRFLGSLAPHALGGTFSAGDRMLVGEKGPEIVEFGSPGYVNANKTAGLPPAPAEMGGFVSSSSNDDHSYTWNGNVVVPVQSSPEAAARAVGRKLRSRVHLGGKA